MIRIVEVGNDAAWFSGYYLNSCLGARLGENPITEMSSSFLSSQQHIHIISWPAPGPKPWTSSRAGPFVTNTTPYWHPATCASSSSPARSISRISFRCGMAVAERPRTLGPVETADAEHPAASLSGSMGGSSLLGLEPRVAVRDRIVPEVFCKECRGPKEDVLDDGQFCVVMSCREQK